VYGSFPNDVFACAGCVLLLGHTNQFRFYSGTTGTAASTALTDQSIDLASLSTSTSAGALP